ncbi:hypothetical protein FSP39_010713 [Pinctada imbricata]|uniref:HTH CENPB-type domain-containing protein n=1 Tax=Pinctada imbricata TaxID=66713 RepID=A0AA89C134_PINIB|nr:hypothetical protein FSP39_010713 [Pinctada imbricata]
MSQKWKVLTLNERLDTIKLLERGKSARAVAIKRGIGKTQVTQILKRKADILEDAENNVAGDRKRKKHKSGNEDINELTLKWFQEAVTRHVPVSGPLLKERALKFAKDLNIDTFKASNGWLPAFINNIVFGTMSGERGDVDNDVVQDWIEKLPLLCRDYSPDDIFNMDETGLLYRDTTRQSFYNKGDDCAGGKRSKERVTLALCSSMTSKKLMPLLIGKAKKPRCFHKIKPESLPLKYKHNRKAWVTSAVFEEWLRNVNNQMKRQKRRILLFVDNAPSHPKLKLENINLQFFPPNVTAKAQPMDQGVIQTLKLKFAKYDM